VTFRFTVPGNAATGGWKITVVCPGAGRASATVAIAAKPIPIQAANIVVDKWGFGTDDGFGTRFIEDGVVLRNTSADQDAVRVEVTVSALDASGLILKSDATTINVIPAGVTYADRIRHQFLRRLPERRVGVSVRRERSEAVILGVVPSSTREA